MSLADTQPIGDSKEGGWPGGDPEKSSDNSKQQAWGMLVAEDSIHFENVALDRKNFSCGKQKSVGKSLSFQTHFLEFFS